ncbi:ABC transporter permease subunit [Oceanicella actignis]|uniref:Putrescine transport system permease protein n=1 Tax=Oceanicella actignis TaxID=1189325 RepID=A0A1M7S1H8_9RHOB|nr:putrescine transport system permease protein [Oceanicella actignis]SHN52142.1 putrescine transport system permease protein [Oceanicella actignis]
MSAPRRRAPLARMGRALVALAPMAWLGVFFLIPFAVVLRVSLAEPAIARPPFTDIWEWADGVLTIILNFGNYLFLLEDPLYYTAYLNSIWMAASATLICLVIAYPMALAIARAAPRRRPMLLMLVVLPFWTSFLLRMYALIGLMAPTGFVNTLLEALGFAPIVMLQTDFAVYAGIVTGYMPLMVLPLYATLEKLDDSLLEAAHDLGAGPTRAFLTVTLPLSAPGIAAGCLLVFIPAVGEYVIPALLGGPDQLMIGKVLWTEFFNNRDWPVASAVAIAMLAFLALPIMFIRNALGVKE